MKYVQQVAKKSVIHSIIMTNVQSILMSKTVFSENYFRNFYL